MNPPEPTDEVQPEIVPIPLVGRPRVWDVETVFKDLLSYFENDPDTLFVESFCANHTPPLCRERIYRWAAESDFGREVLNLVRTIQLSRLLEKGIRGEVNSRICALLLGSMGVVPRSEIAFVAPQEDVESKVQTRVDSLLAARPKDPQRAHAWLTEIDQNTADEITKRAVERARSLVTMCELARQVESAVVND